MSIPLRIHGPAIITFNGVSYYFKSGLKGQVKTNRAKIEVDAFGQIAEVAKDRVVEFTGTPAGVIRAADLAGQMPYLPANIGQSIFGLADTPLTVQRRRGDHVVARRDQQVPVHPAQREPGDALQKRHDLFLSDGIDLHAHQWPRMEKYHAERVRGHDV